MSNKVVTYGATHGDARLPNSISLCNRHDTRAHRIGYANVSFGLHHGRCTVCRETIDSQYPDVANDLPDYGPDAPEYGDEA